jgi:hypothetical protein
VKKDPHYSNYIINTASEAVRETFITSGMGFFKFITISLLLAAVFAHDPQIAMWLGFAFAGYSAIANDSIQTIGTFIASNGKKPWWVLWLYIGLIFVATVSVSFFFYEGDVSYQRLTSKGFEKAPESYHFLQLAAPMILLILTRLKMPVSTTFLLLSTFSTSLSGIMSVTYKSLAGYGLAFTTSIITWTLFKNYFEHLASKANSKKWTVAQWIISGALWSSWIMQDAANIAIFLPRALSLEQFLYFAGYIFIGLGVLFYLRGDRIQSIITEKTTVDDVRNATIIDLVYTFILLVFQFASKIPMSTTWVFLGLLGGREIAIALRGYKDGGRSIESAFKLVVKDFGYATFGLCVSLAIAINVNSDVRKQFFEMMGWD